MNLVFEQRIVQFLDVPAPENATILQPQQIIMRFAHGKTVDVGSLCFLNRERKQGSYSSRLGGRHVEQSTLSARRVKQVRNLIQIISAEARETGLRPETLRSRYSRFLAFMKWADTSSWTHVLDEQSYARAGFIAYLEHIRNRVSRNDLTNNSAYCQLKDVKHVLEGLFGVTDLVHGITMPRRNARAIEQTLPPSEDAQIRVLALSAALFEGLSTLVVDGAPFPHSIEVPDFVDVPNKKLWIFPSTRWLMTSAMEAKRHLMSSPAWPYNFSAGCLFTIDEMRALNIPRADSTNSQRKVVIDAGTRQLHAANTDLQHVRRRQMACVAMNLFIPLFLAETGMNWSPLLALSWHDDFEIEATRQTFRAVKWRAGGRLVSFEIPLAFVRIFKRFLAVRRYLLQGVACDYLFFTLGSNSTDAPMPIKGNLRSTDKLLSRLCPGLTWVTSRQWRAAKSDWLIRNTDLATAAVILQNSERTVAQHYAAGSVSDHLQEMSSFLELVSSAVIDKSEKIANGTTRAVGTCTFFENPAKNTPYESIQPDCKNPEGCLFCDKFKVHADAVDTRKLVSYQYCLRQVSNLIGREDRTQRLLDATFNRIEVFLGEISKRDINMVQRVIFEVNEQGELDNYWKKKLEMLIELELIP